jgi:hypothetical protein
MNYTTKNLFAILTACVIFISCAGGDPTSKNPDVAKLSDTSKKAMDEASKGGCECLKTHGKDLKAVIEEIKPVLAEAEKSNVEPGALMGKLMGPMMKVQDFGECFQKVDKKDEAADKAMEEDLKKIMGDNTDPKDKQKKQMEILQSYFSKNCPNEAKTFDEFMKFGEQMDKTFKKK